MIGFNHLGKLGQLGNQMFQFAATKGIASKLGVDYTIPDHSNVVLDSLGNRLRIELFDCFELKLQHVGEVKTRRIVKEKTFEFNPAMFKLRTWRNFSLYGFFQTEKYFKHVEDEIRHDFSFHKEYLEPSQSAIAKHSSPIALHIRRGDFLINSAYHNNLDLAYYQEALSHFDQDRQVIIFSDDPAWCKEQALFAGDNFHLSGGTSSYFDLCLMSLCSDFIIANSSFSWWGAWLANRGKVIAPGKWFGPNNAHKVTRDIYAEGWVVI